jgi:hypothetical protein
LKLPLKHCVDEDAFIEVHIKATKQVKDRESMGKRRGTDKDNGKDSKEKKEANNQLLYLS